MATKFKRNGPVSKGAVVDFPGGGDERRLMALASTLVGRAAVAARAGYSFGQGRDLYAILGYPRELTFEQYYARYMRQDVAKRVVRAPVDSCWREPPEITENEDGDKTKFEKAVDVLIKKKKLWHYLSRVDRLSGIGRYGVLLLGLDDVRTDRDLANPAVRATQLLYLQPYNEQGAVIQKFVTNTADPRYGLPEFYDIRTGVLDSAGAQATALKTLRVHYSRVIHIAEDLEDNDVFGVPRMQAVYNRLQDLELISGGSAEMFWRGAYPGLAFQTQEGYTMEPGQSQTALEDEINEYLHGLKRYMRLSGLDVNQLSAQVADPEGHANLLIGLISAATGIPQRILMGSERGELASTQDKENWGDRIKERREQHVNPSIIRATLDRLIELGILPAPAAENEEGEAIGEGEEGYQIEWPSIYDADEKDQATVVAGKTAALAQYASTPGMETFMPRRFYLKKFFMMSDDELDEIEAAAEEAQAEEDLDAEAERALGQEDAEFQADLNTRTAVEVAKVKGAAGGPPGAPVRKRGIPK